MSAFHRTFACIAPILIVFSLTAWGDFSTVAVENQDDKSYLERIRDELNVTLMRRHSWAVFQQITRESEGVADWERWIQPQELFRDPCSDDPRAATDSLRSLDERGPLFLREAAQLTDPAIEMEDSFQAPVQSVHYNSSAQSHIRRNLLYSPTELDRLLYLGRRFISPFKRDAIVVKAVWWPVQSGLSLVPVWDGLEPNEESAHRPQAHKTYPYVQWPRLVAISTEPENPETVSVKPPAWWQGGVSPIGEPIMVRVVPITRFYVRNVTAEDLQDPASRDTFNAISKTALGRDSSAGDPMVLVAMHVATKQLDDWVWMTLWWHDQPNVGRFADNRPLDLAGHWANYLMDVTFSATTPREPDGSPKVIFNPWLEGAMRNGVRSNCVTCHQRAAWCNADKDFVVTPLPLPPDHELFRHRVRVDYLWSILREARKKRCDRCTLHNPEPDLRPDP